MFNARAMYTRFGFIQRVKAIFCPKEDFVDARVKYTRNLIIN
jgi:hypothetical protein